MLRAMLALVLILALAMPVAQATTPTSDELWGRGEWSRSAAANRIRVLSVGTTASVTAPFPDGGVCWCDILVVGTSDIQWSTGANVPSTSSAMGVLPAKTLGGIPMAYRYRERDAFTTLRLHATEGTANTVIIIWP
jgi:hypothetical protein